MFVLLERRVGVRRQHFAVRVDVDALAFGLLQDQFEVVQVVAGNNDGLARNRLRVDACRFRMSEGLRLARVEHLHDAVVERADVHRALEQSAAIGRLRAEESHDLVEASSDRAVGLAKNPGVLHVGGSAFQPVQAEQAQADHVLADFLLAAVQREGQRIAEHYGFGVGQTVVGRRGQLFRRDALGGARGLVTGTQVVAVGFGAAGEVDDALGVEVDVGQCRKERLRHVGVDLGIDDADLARGHGIRRHGLQQVHQHVLQIGDFAGLAAHAARKTAAGIALGGTDGVFTLHAKHGNSSPVGIEIEELIAKNVPDL